MAFAVVLDTCALYPLHLRDTLLRLAERGLYRVLWSDDILSELKRSLMTHGGVKQSSIEHLLREMQKTFPDASVHGYQPLAPAMTCDPKDRHVLAAAVRADAGAIVTFNIGDFLAESVDPFAVDVIHPDEFLLDLLDLAPDVVWAELAHQAADNLSEPKSVPALLDALGRAGVPQFAEEVRHQL